jgi:glycosyltransferase involved in cell wall biosynthesis
MNRVLIVAAPIYSLGGGIRHCVAVATAVHEAGWETRLLLAERGAGADARAFVEKHAPFCTTRGHRGGPLKNIGKTLVALLLDRDVRSRSTLVYAPVPQSAIAAYLVFRLIGRRCRLAIGLQGRVIATGLPRWKRLIYTLLLRRCLADGSVEVWSVSMHAAEETAYELHLPANWLERTHILRNTAFATGDAPWVTPIRRQVAPTRARRSPAGSRRLLVLGRLSPEKGVSVAIAALRWLPEGTHLRICGTGPEERSLRAFAEQLGVAHRVQFAGWALDPREELRQADVLLVPSLQEGFPVAVLDALWAGCRVVASAVGGIKELYAACPSALEIVHPGDVHSLARAVETATSRSQAHAIPATLTWSAFSSRIASALSSPHIREAST